MATSSLVPSSRAPDHHQAAQAIIASETNAGVDAVHPHVEVVPAREIAGLEALVLGPPTLGEAGDRRGGQAGLGAEEPLQSRYEVPAGEPVQIQ